MSADWFPDPNDPTRLRYWDGERWTEHTAPMPQAQPQAQPPAQPGWPQPGQPPALGALTAPPLSAQADLESERAGGQRARLALLLGLVCFPAYDVLLLFILRDLVPWMRDSFSIIIDTANSGSGAEPVLPAMPHRLELLQSFGQLVWIGTLVVQILFAIWVYRATLLARRAGLPTTHSPGWTVAGFFVPVVNFWFPYQGLRDLFPAGHAGRRTARLWFVAYLTQILLIPTSIGVAFASLPAATVPVVLGALAGVAQMLLGRAVIKQSLEAHTQLVGTA